jgi:ankyrin repeat protein
LSEGADPQQELSNALIANDHDRIMFLVGKGADVNKRDLQGWTPLTSAARQRHDKTIDLLIELGADPAGVTRKFPTAADAAIKGPIQELNH